jgi:hypothetical protein
MRRLPSDLCTFMDIVVCVSASMHTGHQVGAARFQDMSDSPDRAPGLPPPVKGIVS